MWIAGLPAANAVKVGGLILKPSSVADWLSGCCRLVLHEAGDPALPLWRSGSATLVRYGGTDFVVTTRHQPGLKPGVVAPKAVLETIRISSGNAQLSNIPTGKCVYEEANPDQEYSGFLKRLLIGTLKISIHRIFSAVALFAGTSGKIVFGWSPLCPRSDGRIHRCVLFRCCCTDTHKALYRWLRYRLGIQIECRALQKVFACAERHARRWL